MKASGRCRCTRSWGVFVGRNPDRTRLRFGEQMFLPRNSLLLFIASTTALSAELMREPGAMPREGTWIDDVGAYSVPQAFEKIKPANWPVDRWYRLTLVSDHISSEPVIAPPGQMPTFLRSIVTQLETRATGSVT